MRYSTDRLPDRQPEPLPWWLGDLAARGDCPDNGYDAGDGSDDSGSAADCCKRCGGPLEEFEGERYCPDCTSVELVVDAMAF